MYYVLDSYTRFHVIDRFLSLRYTTTSLADARAAATRYPESFVEGYNYIEAIWVKFSV